MPSENIRKTIKYTAGSVRIIIIQALAVHFNNPTFFSLGVWTYLGCCFIPRLKLFINFICAGQIHWTWDQRLLKNKNFYFLYKYLLVRPDCVDSPASSSSPNPPHTHKAPSINLMIWRTTPSAQQRAFVNICICEVWGEVRWDEVSRNSKLHTVAEKKPEPWPKYLQVASKFALIFFLISQFYHNF